MASLCGYGRCFVVLFVLFCVPAFEATSPVFTFGWIKKDRPNPLKSIPFRIALKQRNFDVLKQIIHEVSDPKNQKYGQYLSLKELTNLISPPHGEIQQVLNWLLSEEINGNLTINNDYINAETTIEKAEKIFGVEFYSYLRSQSKIIRSEIPYQIPKHVEKCIDHIFGFTEFPPKLRRYTKFGGENPGININPSIIKKTYNIDVIGSAGISQSVAEFEEAYFYESDLTLFQKKYNLPLQNLSRIIGPNHPSNGYLGEATLDVEYIVGVGTGIDTWVFSTPGTNFDLVGWSHAVLSTPGAPLIHSVSWGGGEIDFGTDFVVSANKEFMKLASLGYSILVASGDDGTGSTGEIFCGTFNPTFPASSPYVTAVGGTYIDSTNAEIAVDFSGGGFSTIFPRPDYQKSVVESYLKNAPNLPESDYFNSSGRAFPDVSAVATNFEVIIEKYDGGTMSGTSAATPAFAAIISLLNSARSKYGKPPLGFLNPWLYSLGKIGTDITQGNNRVSNCPRGFPATVGWDAISGLGTPDFHLLRK